MAYFQLADPSRSFIRGGYTANAAGEIKTGLLVVSGAAKALTLAGTSDKPDGIALSNRTQVYAPTALTLDAGEYCSVIMGKALIIADQYFFYNNTLPSKDDVLYSVTGGLMRPSTGTNKVGRCIEITDYRTPPNSTTNVAVCELELGFKENV